MKADDQTNGAGRIVFRDMRQDQEMNGIASSLVWVLRTNTKDLGSDLRVRLV